MEPLDAGVEADAAAPTLETASADASADQVPRLRVVTANVSFSISAAKVKADWDRYSEKADIVLIQEARDVDLHAIIDRETWAVRQNTSSAAKRGSAIVVRKSIARRGGVGPLQLIVGVGASSCPGGGINTRYIARVDVDLHEGGTVKLAALHMPPKRCWGSVYDSMADKVVEMVNATPGKLIVGADWNKVVRTDPNGIKRRTGKALKIRAPENSIDGFYIRPSRVANGAYLRPRLRTLAAARKLEETHSDHRPVQWVTSVD